MNKYKNLIFILIFAVIFVGAIVPFGTQFWLPFFNPDAFTAGAEVWNQYVSIVLGIVATILSIISLKMCFSSNDSARQTEIRTQDTLDKIDTRIQLLAQKQDQMYSAVSQNSLNTKVNDVDKVVWNTPNDDCVNIDEEV